MIEAVLMSCALALGVNEILAADRVVTEVNSAFHIVVAVDRFPGADAVGTDIF